MSVLDLDKRTICDALETMYYGEAPKGYVRTYAVGRIDYNLSAREVYSYGRHFPLFRYVPREMSGHKRDLFIINGDEWRPSGPSRTRDHQAMARDRIALTSADSIVIPFSALQGAGIDIDSIRPVHVRGDAQWEETIEVRTLVEVPVWRRTETYQVECQAEAIEDVPEMHRKTWMSGQYLDILPDDEGVYRWSESRKRDISPDADGLYRWTETRHRLGDALFSAVRDGRRARYLSSFDTNENPPLYFLAEVKRGSGDTVETAIDNLAPRVVHAALARGKHVARQGDVFFIDTGLTTGDLAERGAVFARLTQWTRQAKARRGEVNYRRPQTAAERRREIRYACKLWRNRFRTIAGQAVRRESDVRDHDVLRQESRAKWTVLLQRHRHELESAGVDVLSHESSACPTCGVGIGEQCRNIPDSEEIPSYLRGTPCNGIPRGERKPIGERHEREMSDLRSETKRHERFTLGSPHTSAGSRKRWSGLRDSYTREMETKRAELRAAIIGGPKSNRHWSYVGCDYDYDESGRRVTLSRKKTERRNHARAATGARERLETVLERGVRDSNNNTSRAHGRDSYRTGYGANAKSAWLHSRHLAGEKFRPGDIGGSETRRADLERARKVLAVYGTAHSATEVAKVRGAVYVRGVVRHVPELEPGRIGGIDHRPLTLTPGHWYLAVRNTVPRQTRRRRRQTASPTESG